MRGIREQAEAHYREALARFEEVGGDALLMRVSPASIGRDSTVGAAECVAGFAGLPIDYNEPEQAALLLGWVAARFRATATSMWPADRAEYERDMATARA